MKMEIATFLIIVGFINPQQYVYKKFNTLVELRIIPYIWCTTHSSHINVSLIYMTYRWDSPLCGRRT